MINKDQRPKTSLPKGKKKDDKAGKQGDHITNYQTLLQTICSVIDLTEPELAPQKLYEAIKLFLESEDIAKIKFTSKSGTTMNFSEKVTEVSADICPRAKRKQFTADLRKLKHSEEDIAKLKDDAKIGGQ
ncbi:MAG: hypothetical protein ACR2HS_00820, partial [Gammaproteobacteria bacterium]